MESKEYVATFEAGSTGLILQRIHGHAVVTRLQCLDSGEAGQRLGHGRAPDEVAPLLQARPPGRQARRAREAGEAAARGGRVRQAGSPGALRQAGRGGARPPPRAGAAAHRPAGKPFPGRN